MATFTGGSGNDKSNAAGFGYDYAAGNDTMDGLAGNDILQGYRGSDVLLGGPDNDELYGDTFRLDKLSANDGNDQLYGEAGNDNLKGNAGNDLLDGGTDIDMALFSGSSSQYRVTRNLDGSWKVADLRSGSPEGTDTLYGIEFLNFQDIIVAPTTIYPTIGFNLGGAAVNQWINVAPFVSTQRDSANHPITQYQFYDGGSASGSAYFWTPQNPHHPANTSITVNASDLGRVWIRGGQSGGSEPMWVRASDGSDWSDWVAFTFYTVPNTRPTVAVADHSAAVNQWLQVSSWLTTADADGNAITQYQFYDGGTGSSSGYFWTPQNNHHSAGTNITVNAADLANVWIRGGQSGGSETIRVRVFDGTDWSDWDSFTFTTLPGEEGNTFGTAAVRALPYTSSNASVGFNGDTDDFIRFVAPANGTVTANLTGLSADIDLYAYNSSQNMLDSSLASGSTSEMVEFQVVSGQSYYINVHPYQTAASNYSLTVTFMNNTPPVATINNHTVNANQWAQIAGWLSYSDANGNPATQYQFWDGGAAADSGYFWTPGNSHHPAGTAITVAAADLNSVWVRGGQSGGSETMYVRAFDGADWGPWDSFLLIV